MGQDNRNVTTNDGRDRRFTQELSEEIRENTKKMREDRLKREELSKEKTEEIKNDSKPEPEDVPNDKTQEQVMAVSYTHLIKDIQIPISPK